MLRGKVFALTVVRTFIMVSMCHLLFGEYLETQFKITVIIIHQIPLAKTCHVTEYTQAETGIDIPQLHTLQIIFEGW